MALVLLIAGMRACGGALDGATAHILAPLP
jgi:hypothetical protein